MSDSATAGKWLVSCLSIAALSILVGCSGSATVPTTYGEYNARDGTFACAEPDGWDCKGGGKGGPQWATFKSGSSEIHITADLTGSLLGGIAGSSTPDSLEQASIEFEPVHKVHLLGKEPAEKEYPGYTETGDPQVIKVSLGPARQSEFTSKTAFGTGLHGYRVTVLGHDKRVTVFAVCPESDWDTMKPAFDKVIGSLVRGVAE